MNRPKGLPLDQTGGGPSSTSNSALAASLEAHEETLSVVGGAKHRTQEGPFSGRDE